MDINSLNQFGLCRIGLSIDNIINSLSIYGETKQYTVDYRLHSPELYSDVLSKKKYLDAIFYQSGLLKDTLMIGNWFSLCNFLCLKNSSYNFQFFFEKDAARFVFYDNSTEQRIVQALVGDEDKWEFYQNGDGLSFENPKYYFKRKIANRLNKDIIIEYIVKSGIPINERNCFAFDEKSIYISSLREFS
jgi:hypothetical protein